VRYQHATTMNSTNGGDNSAIQVLRHRSCQRQTRQTQIVAFMSSLASVCSTKLPKVPETVMHCWLACWKPTIDGNRHLGDLGYSVLILGTQNQGSGFQIGTGRGTIRNTGFKILPRLVESGWRRSRNIVVQPISLSGCSPVLALA
jgi:hypothetical protein